MIINTYTYKLPVNRLFNEGAWHVAIFKLSDEDTLLEILKWCHETYGPSGYRPNTDEVRWRGNVASMVHLEFAREEDLALFALKFA